MSFLIVCIFLSSVSSNISPCESIPRSDCRSFPDCYVDGLSCKEDSCYDEFPLGSDIDCSTAGCGVYNISQYSITLYALCVKAAKIVKNKCFPYGCLTLLGFSSCSKDLCETNSNCHWVEQNLDNSEGTFGYCNGTFGVVDPEPIIHTGPYGTNKKGCGAKNGPDACATVAFAITQRTDYRIVRLYGGDFSETAGVIVEGEVEIVGESRDGCFLSKVPNDFTLFTMSSTGHTSFIIDSVTIFLNEVSTTAKFLRVGDTSGNVVDALVSFLNCRILQEGTIHGGVFVVYSNKAVLAFHDCVLTNISTMDTYPAIYCPEIRLFEMRRCTVDSALGLNSDPMQALSGLFFLSHAAEFHLVGSAFRQCWGTVGGVGAVDTLVWVAGESVADSTVESCTFERVYGRKFGGALCVGGTGVDAAGRYTHVAVTNTSFVNASAATGENESLEGGALAFRHYIVANVTHCTFQSCRAYHGGALHVRYGAEVTVASSLFSKCTATGGGAAAVEMGKLTVRSSKLVGNKAEEGSNLYATNDDSGDYASGLSLSATCSDRTTASVHTAGAVSLAVDWTGEPKMLPLCPIPLCNLKYTAQEVVNMLAKKKERGDE